jgi:hypothetical protein
MKKSDEMNPAGMKDTLDITVETQRYKMHNENYKRYTW